MEREKLTVLILLLVLVSGCSFLENKRFRESIVYCSYTEESNIIYGRQCLVEIVIENLTNDYLLWNKVVLIGNPDSTGIGYRNNYVQNNDIILGPNEKVIKGFQLHANDSQYQLLSNGKMIEIWLESKDQKIRYPLGLEGDYPCVSGSEFCTQPQEIFFLRRI